MSSFSTLVAATIVLVLGPIFSVQVLAVWDSRARRRELERWLAQRGLVGR
jgi:hypothetical protein